MQINPSMASFTGKETKKQTHFVRNCILGAATGGTIGGIDAYKTLKDNKNAIDNFKSFLMPIKHDADKRVDKMFMQLTLKHIGIYALIGAGALGLATGLVQIIKNTKNSKTNAA